ncbi:putative temperature-induced lipocalin-1 [Iris pallida]|uniref:Temperature-induced lipocalin-1 n=1 Tax=Iris pallida TaxID=29817 RepID=A0AAX6I9V6_IRIPA|nr:putative temperature-induced lipocalin-1 [Iris pallida]
MMVVLFVSMSKELQTMPKPSLLPTRENTTTVNLLRKVAAISQAVPLLLLQLQQQMLYRYKHSTL